MINENKKKQAEVKYKYISSIDNLKGKKSKVNEKYLNWILLVNILK